LIYVRADDGRIRMPGRVLPYLLVLIMVTSTALAGEVHFAVRAGKALGVEALRAAGFMYLADLGDEYLLQGDARAVGRLRAEGADFSTVLRVEPDEHVFLLVARNLRDEMFYARVLVPLGRGKYLVAGTPGRVDVPGLSGFSKMALAPGDFPKPCVAMRLREPVEVYPKPPIQAMIAEASPDSIWALIAGLSGYVPVMVDGTPDTLFTRYSFSPRSDRAARYLHAAMQGYGIDVEYHEFVISSNDLFCASFIDAGNGWVAGSEGHVYRTADAGAAWLGRDPAGQPVTLYGICFVDSLRGWVAGRSGTIYHTDDGGVSWTLQSTPGTAALRAVCFVDSLRGYAAGHSGVILHTSDGGLNWADVTSGTSEYIYGLHFRGAERGWACGRNGTLLFWDGVEWSHQQSGVEASLMEVYFSDDSTGYAVGSAGTVLRTVNGGQDWVARPAPPDVNPYFESVCFIDSLEGWCVGLGGTILHTGDGGSTWQQQMSGTLFGLQWVEFENAQEGWTGGYGGTILHTIDGGLTWVSQKGNLPPEAITVLRNVVGTLEGTASDEQIVVCGHYDSISEDPMSLAPGADDNASGTAAVVEALRVLSAHSFERTVKFICFSGEEIGLHGSGAYAADARLRGDDIAGVLNLDMIAYVDAAPEEVDLVCNGVSEWLADFAAACARAYLPGFGTRKTVDPAFVQSDHSPFWNSGYCAILAIEDEDIVYPHYHTAGDTLGNLTMSFAGDVTRLGIAAVAELAIPDSVTSVPERDRAAVRIAGVYPNPFGGSTRISFALGAEGHVDAGIYDVEGRLVRTLLASALPPGTHELRWDGEDSRGRRVSPGIYFISVAARDVRQAAKVIVLR
jgi:photosystem II stability/assembly factor-like uncharacterized protein